MTVSSQPTSRQGVVARCAVCKVDLRGRFVFVDDRTEQLFGHPREELFGKPFADFLEQPSQDLVRELINRRNHYETFYDAVNITIASVDGVPLSAGAIVSLNFIAGNPVNFQWIINAERTADDQQEPPAGAGPYRELAEYLVGIDINADWRSFLRQLRTFTGARQACAYIVAGEKLEHRSSAVDGDDAKLSFARVTEPGEIHRQVAATGKRYDFTDQESVSRAIELNNLAPNEVIGRLEFDDDTRYLVRLVFENDIDDAEAEACSDRSRFALDLAQMLIAPPRPSAEDLDDENLKFTVGLLDGLQIGCMSTDSRGRIVIYNPTLAKLLEAEELDGDLSDFALLLHRDENAGAAHAILDYLQPAVHAKEIPPPPLEVLLPTNRGAHIHYLALSDTPDDLSAFIAVIPAGARADLAGKSCLFWSLATASLRSQLNGAGEKTGVLLEQSKKKLGADNFSAVQNVDALVADTAAQLDYLGDVAVALGIGEPVGRTDLTLVVNEAVSAVTGRFPHTRFTCDFRTLGKLHSRRGCLKVALENLLSAIIRSCPTDKVEVSITAESGDLEYALAFVWSSGSPKGKEPSDEDAPPPEPLNPPEASVEYAVAELLVESLGGRLETDLTPTGAVAVCRLPNK